MWQAVFFLAPLLLLTGIGLRGLMLMRQAARDDAVLQIERAMAQARPEISAKIATLRASACTVVLYPETPIPPADSPAQAQFDAARALPRAEAQLALDRLGKEKPESLAASGLPLLPLIRWEQLRLETDPTALSGRAVALQEIAIATHPSIISPQLLERAKTLLQQRIGEAGPLAHWPDQWIAYENARIAFEENKALLAASSTPLWISSSTGKWRAERESAKSPYRLLARMSLPDFQRAVLNDLNPLWPYARMEISLDGVPASFTEPPAREILWKGDIDGFSFTAYLQDPGQIYAAQRRLSRWLAALVACAFAAEVAAFLAMRRSLLREAQLGELKSDFVSSVSHELRAPIASMRIMAENLESDAVTEPERRRDYHRLLAEECRRLSVLIDNVLDFARIEQNRRTYRFEESDVVALARDAVQLLHSRASERRQRLHAELAVIEPPPACDSLAVRQALINLLDNAIKFSPEDSEIVVRLQMGRMGDMNAPVGWQLSVTDQGPGIPSKEQGRIFERFYRLGSEMRRETQGAGIGLSIVQHIVEGHGGSVAVGSAPGAGATFTLHFPLNPNGSAV